MNFLFISEVLPIDTYASEVVFYRHFKMLVENGHTVHLLTDKNSYLFRKKDLHPQFNLHILPNRKWYYLPFKPYGFVQRLRFLDYYHFHVKPILREHKIDRLIGFIHGNFLLAFTAYLQKKSKLPLFCFFHDDTNELNFKSDKKSIDRNTRIILSTSQTVFTASVAFNKNWPKYAHKFILLYPIPTSINQKKINTTTNENCNIVYSGSVYNEIIPSLDQFSSLLKKLNVTFTIIGNNSKVECLEQKYAEVKCLPLFDTAEQANNFIIDNCKICLIAYPEQVSEMPWINTSFPSKFIQYCSLGLPTIIVAPKDSAMGEWCITNNWILYTNSYDYATIKELIDKSMSDQKVVDQVNYFKTKIFLPKTLHNQFQKILLG